MTQTSAFHFESLVWDWPIAIYLFLIGISAGLVTLAVLLRRVYPQAGGADSTLLRTTLIVGPGAVILGLLILVFHLTRPWTFWKLMFHYSFTSVMSMGVMLFQLYMVVLVLWLAKIFEHDLLALQQRWLPKLGIVQKVLSLLTPVHRGLETLMLVLAVLLGAYTGFLLSALKSYPFLNNPILPVLFLFSGISSGAAVALIAMAICQRKIRTPRKRTLYTVWRSLWYGAKSSCWWRFLSVWPWAMTVKCVRWWQHWAAVSGRGGSGLVSPGWG